MGRRASRAVAATVSIAFLRVTRILPLALVRALGRGIGIALFHLVPRVRRVALGNLDIAYGDSLSDEEKRRIAREAAINIGLVAAEFSRASSVKDGVAGVSIRVEGLEHIEPGCGALIIGGHFANWEWMANAIAATGRSMGGVIRPLDNPRLNRVVDRIRRDGGLITIDKDSARGEVIRRIKEGGLIGILADQSPRENGVPVTFFGHPTWATGGPALVALRGRVPIHASIMTRDDKGGYTVRFSPRIEAESTGDLIADLLRITQRCQDEIEAAVRRNPGQWLWMHRRFKERPRLKEEWEARLARRKSRSK